MKKARVKLEVEMTPDQLVDAISQFAEQIRFEHEVWSIWQAEKLERVARFIREGYECNGTAETAEEE